MEKNLITITEQNGNKAVSARELHSFLEVNSNFTTWAKRMFEYGFEEGKDYSLLSKNGKQTRGGHNEIDYALTLDTAKEISMLQRTEKGKQARQYFIELEKSLKNIIPELSRKQLAMMVIQQEEENERLQLENEKMRPRSEFVDKVFNTEGLVAIGEVAKILKLPYGRNTLFNVLKQRGVFFKNKNEPYQKFVTKGYFELKEKFQERKNHPPLLIIQTFATQKGLGFIAKELGIVSKPTPRVKMIN
jgi:anti-repressor protein